MSLATCYNCGSKFVPQGLMVQAITGNAGNIACPDCVRTLKDGDRQAAHHQQLSNIAAIQAGAVAAAAAAQVEAAERQARAAEHAAAAQAEAVKMQARAQLAQAVGSLDADGLARFKEQEQKDADKRATDGIFNALSAAFACLESGGKSTDKINEPAYPPDGDSVNNTNGVAAAVAWQNLTRVIQVFTEARERTLRITHWSAPTSQEFTLNRIEGGLRAAKDLRAAKAKEAVSTILRGRASMHSVVVAMLGVAAGAAIFFFAGSGGIITGLLGFMIFLVALIVLGLSGSAAGAKSPSAWQEIRAEAGNVGRKHLVPFAPGVGVLVAALAGGGIASAVVGPEADPKTLVLGTWTREGHELEVAGTAMRLDLGRQNINIARGFSKDDDSTVSFAESVIHEGIFSDDKCSGTLEVRGNTLVVIAGGHSDCAGFAGNWSRGNTRAGQ